MWKKCGKVCLSVVLTVMLLFGVLPVFPAGAAVSYPNDVCFVVPEAIYLVPDYDSYSTSDSYAFQWYVNNTVNADGEITPQTGESAIGNVYFAYDATSIVDISYAWVGAEGGSITLGFEPLTPGDVFGTGYFADPIPITDGLSPELAAGQSGVFIRWTARFIDENDGKTKSVDAYTYVYKPYVQPVGVAIKGKNNRGSNHFGSDLSWISGVHGLADQGTHYPNTEGKAFLPFSSSAGSAQVGDLNVQMNTRFTTTAENETPLNWLTTTQGVLPDQSMRFFAGTESSHSSGDDYVVNYAYSPTAVLSVDSSRYTNLNQIPNLSVGLMVTDDEDSDTGAAWFISNFTAHTSEYANDFTDYIRVSDDSVRSKYWDALYGNNTYDSNRFACEGNWNALTASESEGVKANTRWTKAVSADTATETYYIGTGYANQESSDRIYDVAELRCQVALQNKAALRAAVQEAIGASDVLNSAVVTDAAVWAAYAELYTAASKMLTKLDSAGMVVTAGGKNYFDPDVLAAALSQATADLLAAWPQEPEEPQTSADVRFIVPEAIYLAPDYDSYSTSDSYPFQWYVNNTLGADGEIAMQTGESSIGYVNFVYDAASFVDISYAWVGAEGGSITLGFEPLAPGDVFGTGSLANAIPITAGASPELAAGQTGVFLRWTARFVDANDGKTKSVDAYTYVYKPYVQPVGVAIRGKNTRGQNHYGSDLSWISGVHGVADQGTHYPNTEGKAFLPFSSSAGNVQVGDLNVQLNSRFTSTAESASPVGWLTTTQGVLPDKSMRYLAGTEDAIASGDMYTLNYAYSPTAVLAVDSSRYTDLSQIPNLSVGLMVTDDENSDAGAAWFLSNFTAHTSAFADDFTDYISVTDDSVRAQYWDALYGSTQSDADRFASEGNWNALTASEVEGVKANSRWAKAISADSATETYYIGTGYANKQNYDRIYDVAELRCQVTLQNKAALRAAVQEAIAASDVLNSAVVTDAAAWAAYAELYAAASEMLTKLDSAGMVVTAGGTNYSDPDVLAAVLSQATTDLLAAWPQEAPTTMSFTASETAGRAGDEVKVTVSVQDNPGFITAKVALSYDSAKLRLTAVENGSLFDADVFTPGDVLSKIPFTTIWTDSIAENDVTADGTLVTYTFEILADAAAGETPITITVSDVFNKALQGVSYTVVNGAVDVKDCLPGDVSGDGILDLRDIVMARRRLAGWAGAIDEFAADVDRSGTFTLKDVTIMLRYLAGWEGYVLR